MKRYILFCFTVLLFNHYVSAGFSASGASGDPFQYTSGLSGTGIEKIYIFNGLTGSTILYTTSSSDIVTFYTYTTSLSDKQPVSLSNISTSSSGNQTIYTISNIQDSKGYVAETNGSTSAVVGVLDYNLHKPVLNSISVTESDDKCTFVRLQIDKSDELLFYTPAGRALSLDRLYDLQYQTLDSSTKDFTETTNKFESILIGTEQTVDAPLTDTKFILSGDQIAKHFGIETEIESAEYTAVAVKGFIEAEQTSTTDNSQDSTDLGGSAPAQIQFTGYANEPVALYYTWFIYNSKNPDDLVARYMDKSFTYTFNNSGDYTIILEVANRSSSCPDTTSIQFSISESALDAPNYLAVGGDKEFKVYYKSLVKFKCSIFNRWGNKIYEWTDPAKGWDGKYKGSYVSTGVYFYIITAEGSDGRKYKLDGDINVLRSKQSSEQL